MSSIPSLQLTTPVAGETTFESLATDLLRHNSLAYSLFYQHPSLAICNVKLYFSTDGLTFTLYKTITMNVNQRVTGNELIPSRYFKFEVENPAPDAMSAVDIFFTAFVNVTSNIDVNIGADDIVISGVATEATQLLVKSAVQSIADNVSTSVKQFDIESKLIDINNVLDNMKIDTAKIIVAPSTQAKQTDIENKLIDVNNVLDNMKIDTAKIIVAPSTEAKQDNIENKLIDINNVLDNMKIDTAKIIVAPSTEAKQDDIENKLIDINNVLDNMKIDTAKIIVAPSTQAKQDDIENKLIEINNVLDNMKIDTAKIIVAPSTEAKQDTANLTLTDIKTNLTRVAPTDNAVAEAIPVRLMVGNGGSFYNALRSIGQDLGVYVDDMNPDAVVNSGIASKAVQDSTKLVVDDINISLSKARTTATLYTNSAVTANDVSASISIGDSKDRYTQIQLVGDSATDGFKFILQYSTDNVAWFSDGVESSHYNNGTRYEFSVSRINISVPYIRVKSIVSGATVNMSYSLTK
jgi:hypothetical protein